MTFCSPFPGELKCRVPALFAYLESWGTNRTFVSGFRVVWIGKGRRMMTRGRSMFPHTITAIPCAILPRKNIFFSLSRKDLAHVPEIFFLSKPPFYPRLKGRGGNKMFSVTSSGPGSRSRPLCTCKGEASPLFGDNLGAGTFVEAQEASPQPFFSPPPALLTPFSFVGGTHKVFVCASVASKNVHREPFLTPPPCRPAASRHRGKRGIAPPLQKGGRGDFSVSVISCVVLCYFSLAQVSGLKSQAFFEGRRLCLLKNVFLQIV